MEFSRRQVLGVAALALSCKARVPARGDAAVSDLAPARRIVSLAPAVTEMLFALGVGDRVVGVSTLCDTPAAAARLPRVGTMVAPSYEAIAALRPDALVRVAGPANAAVIERLTASGVRAYSPRVESMADLRAALLMLAALGGRPAAGPRYLATIDSGLARVRSALAGRPRPRVVAVYNQEPLVVAGRGSWVGELIELAGGDNAVLNASKYPLVSVEQVMSYVPQVLLDLTAPSPPLAQVWAQHASIPAIASGRVRRIEDPVVRGQGPRVVEAVTLLARAMYPGVAV